MGDFQNMNLQLNTGSDLSANFGTDVLTPGGVAGAMEVRFCATGAGGLLTAGNWPIYPKPGSVQLVPECWGILTDTGGNASVTGNKVTTYYNGTTMYNYVARWAWDQVGTFGSAPQITCFADTSQTAPVPGQQPPLASNDTVTNGSADTGNTSYIKANAWDCGVNGSGVQQAPPTNGTSLPVVPTATDGTAGALIPGSGAWIPTHWQSLQGLIQWIQARVTPGWTTHSGTSLVQYYWYWTFALFTGANMTVNSAIQFDFFLLYTYS